MEARGKRGVLTGLLGAVVATAAYFYRAAFSNGIFIARDIQRLHYPLKHYWAQRVLQGGFPAWFPYDGLGESYPGVLQAGAFHPFNLLYLGLPLGWALKLNLLLGFPLALWGVFLLARGWGLSRGGAALAATVYAFGGYLVSLTWTLPGLLSAASLPLALWAADRFLTAPSVLRAVSAAALLSLVLFAGDGGVFALGCVAVGVLALARHEKGRGAREGLSLLGLWALTFLFSAAQLLPVLSLPHGLQAVPANEATVWSLHPLRLLEPWLGPLFAGGGSTAPSMRIDQQLLKAGANGLWADSLHVGGVALVLAVVALVTARHGRRGWLLAGCVAVGLLLALGRYGGLFSALHAVLPPFRAFTFPERISPFFLLPLALASAAGLDVVQRKPEVRRFAALGMGAFALLCFGLLALERGAGWFSRGLVTALWTGNAPGPEILERLSSAVQRGCGMTGAAAITTFIVLASVPRADVRAVLVPAICGVHLFVANESLYDLTYPDLLDQPNAFVEAVRAREGKTPGGARVLPGVEVHTLPPLPGLTRVDSVAISTAAAMEQLTPSLHGLESADATLPATSQRLQALRKRPQMYLGRFSGMLGARYITASMARFAGMGGARSLVLAESAPLQLVLVQNPTAVPRAYVARPRCVASAEEAYAKLTSSSFQPGRAVVVECPQPLPGESDAPLQGEATVVTYLPEEVELRVETGDDAVVVLNDAYYPGWSATVDGTPVDILPANYVVRAVPVGKGAHTVRFTFRAPGLRAGAWTSGLSFLLALGLGLGLEARRRGKQAPPPGTAAPAAT